MTGLLLRMPGASFSVGWYLGRWTGNFSLLLFVLTVVTFVYWLAERFYFAPRRRAAVAALEQQDAARRDELARRRASRSVDDNVASAAPDAAAAALVARLDRPASSR